MAALATISDLYVHGIPATAAVPAPREIERVDIGTGRVLTKGHGLIAGDVVRFEGQGTLPAPLAALTNYTATPIDFDTFSIPVSFTDAGAKPYQWRVVPYPAFNAALLAASSTVQDHATAHGEITTATPQLVRIVCILAAWDIVFTNRLGLKIAESFRAELLARYNDAWITIRSWEKGRRIAGVVDATPSVPEMGAITGGPASGVDDWGWGVGL